jgi:hypothetical protein
MNAKKDNKTKCRVAHSLVIKQPRAPLGVLAPTGAATTCSKRHCMRGNRLAVE